MIVTFQINFHTVWGQKIGIVGSIPELGNHEPALAKEMNYAGDGNWRLTMELPGSVQTISYRYVLMEGDQLTFEDRARYHRFSFDDPDGRYLLYDHWQLRPEHLPFYSFAFTKSFFAHPQTADRKKTESNSKLTLRVLAPRVERGRRVALTGDHACLGNWDTEQALFLYPEEAPVWSVDIDASTLTFPLQCKFFVCDENKRLLYWEEGENRTLDIPLIAPGEQAVVSDLCFRENRPLWRGAGTVIPVFSLRSEHSFGVGDFGDLQMMVDWAKKTGQCIIQVLPMNDTIATYTWRDSYPYSAISVYALHPMYLCLAWLKSLCDCDKMDYFAKKQKELNACESVDYESVVPLKLDYCRAYFRQEGKSVMESDSYKTFFKQNTSWLIPYAAYSYLRDVHHTADFSQWNEYAVYDLSGIRKLCATDGKAYPELSFYYFLQYLLHLQFKRVSDYAREQGVALKGDLPIGVSRTGVEVWTEPQYFNLDGQAGAPPDDFSVDGQNWMFPTYNWPLMAKDDYAWWKKRFAKLEDYFDCFRIDHILGFFRIWEIPVAYVKGLCGHFSPALPLTKTEIEQYGLAFDERRFTRPHIAGENLSLLFGEDTEEVKAAFLAQASFKYFVLKPFCDTQRKIEALFAGKEDAKAVRIRNGLCAIAHEVLFLHDPQCPDRFHPRIVASESFLYKELADSDRQAFDRLYWHFFYHRHNDFWKKRAFERLTPLSEHTGMLICGEDLGMIPASVPEVMNELQILSLEIERMPKKDDCEFADLTQLPYHSVCTTSTHDMSPLRSWWKEDREKTSRYYRNVLQQTGTVPEECTSEIASQILSNHLNAPSMLVIIPWQDWMAIDDALKRGDADAERINVPANAHHYWRYRMHITLETLLQADRLNERIAGMIKRSNRG